MAPSGRSCVPLQLLGPPAPRAAVLRGFRFARSRGGYTAGCWEAVADRASRYWAATAHRLGKIRCRNDEIEKALASALPVQPR